MMNKLKRQRKLAGLTQHELSRKAGVSPGRIAWVESGRTKLRPDEEERIKAALVRRAAEVTRELSA
jgi:transcriptional regulator with XRE-family HTH domain